MSRRTRKKLLGIRFYSRFLQILKETPSHMKGPKDSNFPQTEEVFGCIFISIANKQQTVVCPMNCQL